MFLTILRDKKVIAMFLLLDTDLKMYLIILPFIATGKRSSVGKYI